MTNALSISIVKNAWHYAFIFLVISFFTHCKTGGSASKQASAGPIRTLIVGGGSSHDFNRWYKQSDSTTLATNGFATVTYTSNIPSVLSLLPQTDVLYLSNNQPMADPQLRQAIFDFVKNGKGVVLAHAATWYNHRDWPEYNKQLVGGGSRSHERYGNFDVRITDSNHPITKNISEKTFNIKDELYRMNIDSTGAPIKVLAIATVPNTTTTYPLLWVTSSEKGRIVCFTLGHDGEAHDKPVYQELLKNAIKWAAGRS
jgi:uncharacterized protein